MSLLDDLVSHWKLDEASGTRADSHGSNDLTDNNTVTSETGKIGNAAEFAATNSEYLSRADNADLSVGDIDFTFACWVKLTSKGGLRTFIAKFQDGGGNNAEYWLSYNSGMDVIEWRVSHNGSDSVSAPADSLGSPDTDVWYFIICDHDATENTVSIQVNNGAIDSVEHTTGVFNGIADFNLGALRNGGANFHDGLIDSVSFWKRVLTADERTQLYNGGDGLDYDDFAPVAPAGRPFATFHRPRSIYRPRQLR